MSTLNWESVDNEQQARVERNGVTYRIRAVQDGDMSNPFEDGDCNWPIVVRNRDRHSAGFTAYDFGTRSSGFDQPFDRFNAAQLLHRQVHIAKSFNTTVRNLIECFGLHSDDMPPEGKILCRDADVLRDVFAQAWDDWTDGDKFELAVKLYGMVDIVAVSKTVTGYSQGDWAEVLVIATPEAIEKFGCTTSPTTEDLEGTADLYGWWAFGDCYGYIVELWSPASDVEPEDFDPDFDEGEWLEVEDGSCWGYYGPDHDKSGLEEAALECLPELVAA